MSRTAAWVKGFPCFLRLGITRLCHSPASFHGQAAARVFNCGAVQEGECIAWRGSKCITFSDPFGHGLCLIEFIGDGYRGDVETKTQDTLENPS